MLTFESTPMREIGSEFYTPGSPVNEDCAGNEAYLLSGRTALRFILDDIAQSRSVRKALIPAYCCESIIAPFMELGIDVQFYGVGMEGISYPYGTDADVVLIIDFWGYAMAESREIAHREKQDGKIVIYDSTHKIDGNPDVEREADYSFCSYRKWFYCNYAKAVKYNGEFFRGSRLLWNERYIALRDEAAREKAAYLASLTGEKEVFLSKFMVAEQMLDHDYHGYAGIPVSCDLPALIGKRRENASFLIQELQRFEEIQLWRNTLQPEDVPMFVPIFVSPYIRDRLRSHLINARIYCPIHWPKSSYHRMESDLYDVELSLVCDQRYDLTDMERMIQVVSDFFNR